MISPQTILVIEDHAACRAAWELLSEELWPEVQHTHAGTMQEAERALAQALPDLVITDLRLPDSPPRETITRLATLLPPYIPLVVISGSVLPIEGYDLLRLGADVFCSKGMDTIEMRDRLYMAWAAACGRRNRAAQHKGGWRKAVVQ